jgi:ABC-type glycerol-3-phosphate transport system substrate-binding protein
MKRIAMLWMVAVLTAGACAPAPAPDRSSRFQPGTRTPRPAATKLVASRLGVDEQALDGLVIEVWHPWFGVEASFFETLVEEFNGSNTWGIQVRAVGQINFSYLYENVTTSLASTSRPDMVIALPEHALGWNGADLVADLTPYSEDPRYGIESTDFPIIFWNQDLVGQRRLALPAQRSARFLLWNESWAGELGFGAPPATSSDFREQACAANGVLRSDSTPANDGRGGWIIGTDAMTAYSWLLAFQGGVLEGNDYRFLTPTNISAFQFLKDLLSEGCGWLPGDRTEAPEAFANRQALFASAGLEDLPGQLRAFALAGNADKWTVIAFPGDEVVAIYGSSYVLLKSSEQEQLAGWLFMRWLTDPEQDARWVETTHLFPLRTSTLELLTDYQRSHPQWLQAVQLLPKAHLQPQLASWRAVKVMLGDGFECMFLGKALCAQPPVVLATMESTSHDLPD